MARLSLWPAILGVALAMTVVTLIEPVAHSMAYAAAVLTIIGLLGWVVEARAVAGPPPAVEPEHEEEEEAPGPSYWPIVLALGIVGIAAGIIYDFGHGGLVIALPLALWSGGAWASVLRQEMFSESEPDFSSPPLVTASGQVLQPVPQNVLATQASGGAAIALEHVESKQVSRRSVLRLTFWTGLSAGLLGFAGTMIDFLYPRNITGFGAVIPIGLVTDYPPGSKTEVSAGKFWLVNLTEEQGGPGFLALYWMCPHLGCTVPWRETFNFVDPETGRARAGWFNCPCHGSTYNDAGVRVFGPAPRSLDRMDLSIDPDTGRISVNTGSITNGTPDNATYAVQA